MSSASRLGTPFRATAAIAGAMLIIAGAIALATGEFDIAGIWVLVVGLAAAGVAGIVRSLTALLAER